MKRSSAFTLIEVLVVILILSALASLANMQYLKMIERAKEKHAILSLLTIGGAEKIYFARHGEYWPGTGAFEEAVPVINTVLGINISDLNDLFIQCGGGDIGYQCRAFFAPGGDIKWVIESRAMVLNGEPFCPYVDERCPTCKTAANGGCL